MKAVESDRLSNLCFFLSCPASMWPRCRSSSSSCIYWPPWEDLRFGSHWWVWYQPHLAANVHAICSFFLTVASWCLWFQIPVLNIQMKMVPAICTFLGAIFSCTNYFRVIFTGGVGKNGSTIAVSSVSWMSPNSESVPSVCSERCSVDQKHLYTEPEPLSEHLAASCSVCPRYVQPGPTHLSSHRLTVSTSEDEAILAFLYHRVFSFLQRKRKKRIEPNWTGQ